MDNMRIYSKGRSVPENAKKTIQAGKLKGFTDINPMWRIQVLTELFGPCGFGWYTEIRQVWTEEGRDGRVAAFCEISLYVRIEDEWSRPIVGIGGSMLVNQFKGQPETSDECFKMAYTDAISVACKALGIGADVYWESGRTKYSQTKEAEKEIFCISCGNQLPASVQGRDKSVITGRAFAEKFGGLCPTCFLHGQKEGGGA